MDDPLPWVRLQALQQLGTFSKVGGIPASPIAEFLKDPHPAVRSSAARALGAMQAKEQVPELVKLLKDPGATHMRRQTILFSIFRLSPGGPLI